MRASGNEEHKENDKEYSLYTEQIAPNPRKKIKKTMMKALKIVASAALFGTVAAIFFVFFSSVAGKLKNNDEEPESPTITFTPRPPVIAAGRDWAIFLRVFLLM